MSDDENLSDDEMDRIKGMSREEKVAFAKRFFTAWREVLEADAWEDITSNYVPSGSGAPCPMPLEWHPAYRHQTWLLDWLNDTGPYGDRYHIQLPKHRRPVFMIDPTETYPTATSTSDRSLLTKKRCIGRAPYVGRPFAYTWNVAVDDLGRCIADEARLQYTISEPEWFMYGKHS